MLKVTLLSILAIFTVPFFAYAEPSIGLSSDQNTIEPLDSILVYGNVSGVKPYSIVNLSVIAPDGEIVYSPDIAFDDDGNFKRLIHPTLPSFKPGVYSVVASHEEVQYSAQIQFSVSGKELSQNLGNSQIASQVIESKINSDFYIIADAINGDTEINIHGKTIWIDRDVTITVSSPTGNLITVAQLTPNTNGEFSTKIHVGGSLWKQDGVYNVTAFQGDSSELNDTVTVEITDGVVVPEFGTIAVMILAVAIISIIVVSTKSRLLIRF